jgi:segregation and condensation protein B
MTKQDDSSDLEASLSAALQESAAVPEEAAPVASGTWDGPTRVAEAEEIGELAAQSVVADDESPTPPVAEARLESIIESLLFAADRPLAVADIKRLLGERDSKKVATALDALKARHDDTGIQLCTVAGGYHLRTHPGNGAWVAKLVTGRPQRLSRALLETLAIVAYRQPVTRPEIDEIRGVDCGPVLKTLLDRGLIRMIGKREDVGRPILYGTTPEFLRTFSLRDLNELPTLREFHELSEAHQAEVEAKAAAAAAAAGDAAPEGAPPSLPPPIPADAATAAADQRALDDEEEILIEELDRATAAAAEAVGPPPGSEPAGPPPGGPDAS